MNMGVDFEAFYLVEQPLFVDPNTMGIIIGNPKAVVLLDDSF